MQHCEYTYELNASLPLFCLHDRRSFGRLHRFRLQLFCLHWRRLTCDVCVLLKRWPIVGEISWVWNVVIWSWSGDVPTCRMKAWLLTSAMTSRFVVCYSLIIKQKLHVLDWFIVVRMSKSWAVRLNECRKIFILDFVIRFVPSMTQSGIWPISVHWALQTCIRHSSRSTQNTQNWSIHYGTRQHPPSRELMTS